MDAGGLNQHTPPDNRHNAKTFGVLFPTVGKNNLPAVNGRLLRIIYNDR